MQDRQSKGGPADGRCEYLRRRGGDLPPIAFQQADAFLGKVRKERFHQFNLPGRFAEFQRVSPVAHGGQPLSHRKIRRRECAGFTDMVLPALSSSVRVPAGVGPRMRMRAPQAPPAGRERSVRSTPCLWKPPSDGGRPGRNGLVGKASPEVGREAFGRPVTRGALPSGDSASAISGFPPGFIRG
jgi:hypothetical protein